MVLVLFSGPALATQTSETCSIVTSDPKSVKKTASQFFYEAGVLSSPLPDPQARQTIPEQAPFHSLVQHGDSQVSVTGGSGKEDMPSAKTLQIFVVHIPVR